MVFLPSERTGGNIMKKEIETKICSCCGKELKLNKFIKNRRLCKVGFRKEYKTSYQSVCKDCRNEKRQNTLKEKGMSLYDNGKLVQIRREYKKINLNRFLKQTEAKLEYLDRHERFVKLLYYDNTWISNYGRPVIKKEDGTYEFVKGKRNKITQEIEYSLRKNIYIKTKKAWGYKQERVSASSLFMIIIGEEHDLGVFDTKEECYEAFEKRKKEFIIKLAEKTKKKDKIPECQYQAMINWEVKAKE